VTERLLELLDPRPGERILEVGTGLGEVGARVAQLVGESGEVVLSDLSAGMLNAAEQRLGSVPNVTFALADAESTGFAAASFDRVVSRFALMLAPNVTAAFAEARRVLRPAGRLAFAVWTAAEDNPWGSTIGRALVRLGLADPPEPDAPGPFRLAEGGRLQSLLAASGFDPPRLETVDIAMRYESASHYWEVTQDLSSMFRQVLERSSEEDAGRLRAAVDEGLEPYTGSSGVALPGRAWIAAADAV
jgi:SAM-dependent methyltransferase